MGRKKKKGGKKVDAKASSSSSSSSSSTAILGPRGAFDKQTELRLLGVKSGTLARTGRAAAKSFNTESTQCQSELERYNTFCSRQWTDHIANKLTPVKMAAFIKATYTESVQRGNWNYATAKQHLVILGWWWRHYTTEAIDTDTHTLRYTSVPPLSGNLMDMSCINRAMRIVKGAATTYRETAPVLLKTEQALNRGDFALGDAAPRHRERDVQSLGAHGAARRAREPRHACTRRSGDGAEWCQTNVARPDAPNIGEEG